MTQLTKTVIITGGNSGLGFQCAKVLAQSNNYHLIIASRSAEKIDAAIQKIKAETNHLAITGMQLDLASQASIRGFATDFLAANFPPLHSLVCNAGLSPMQNSTTADGIDTTFGVNHLGHYLLAHLLSDQLIEGGRLIFVSSGTHLPDKKLARRLGVPEPKYSTARNLAYPDEAPSDDRVDNPSQRYSTSKLCNVLATYEFARQFKAANKPIDVFALDPGLMPGTELVRDAPNFLKPIFAHAVRFVGRWHDGIREPSVSGEHLARLVTDPNLTGRSALYFDGDEEVESSADSYNRAKATDLWNTSAKLCSLPATDTILPIAI